MGDAVLVTGAGGFVGSAVVRHLVRRLRLAPLRLGGGHEAGRLVAVLRPGEARTRLEELEPHEGWSIIEVDLSRPDAVRSMVAGVRPVAIVHAALSRLAFCDDEAARNAAVATPLIELVQALGACGGRRFVHTGSCWVLPGGPRLDESVPPAPGSPYALAKDLEDRLLPEHARRAGVEWLNLRLFNLFGRYERAQRLIPYLVSRLTRGLPAELSEGENVRDFTDVSVAAEAYEAALTSPHAANQLYHIGTGHGTAIADIAALVAQEVGRADLLHFGRRRTPDGHLRTQVANVERARGALGWNPPKDVADGIVSTARWWRQRLGSNVLAL